MSGEWVQLFLTPNVPFFLIFYISNPCWFKLCHSKRAIRFLCSPHRTDNFLFATLFSINSIYSQLKAAVSDKSAAWKVQQKPAVHDQSLCLPLLNHVRRTTSCYKVTQINTTVMAHRMEGPKYRTQGLLRKKKSKSLIDRLKAIHRRSVSRANKSDMKQAKRQSQKQR